MLVLSRKLHEKIALDVPPSAVSRRILVSVAEIDRGKVKIGLEADRDVKIMRLELMDQPPKGGPNQW